MPLKAGGSRATISHNMQILIEDGYEPKQAAAIAYSEARRTTRSKTMRKELAKTKVKTKRKTKKHASRR